MLAAAAAGGGEGEWTRLGASALGRAANKGPAVMKLPEKEEVASWLAATAAAGTSVVRESSLRSISTQTLTHTRLAEP